MLKSYSLWIIRAELNHLRHPQCVVKTATSVWQAQQVVCFIIR